MGIFESIGAVAAVITAIAGAVGAVIAVMKKLESGKSTKGVATSSGDRVNIRAGRDATFIKDSFNQRSEK